MCPKYFSFDFYAGPLVSQSGKLVNASSPFYCPVEEDEAVCVAKLLRAYVYPKLHPHQQVFVVPGLFGAKEFDPASLHRFDLCLILKYI